MKIEEQIEELLKGTKVAQPQNELAQKEEKKSLSNDDLPEGEQPKNPAAKEAMQVKKPIVFAEHEEKSDKEEDEKKSKFTSLENKLAKKPGVYNPAGLAAAIGRKKLGNKVMAARAAAGHKSHEQEVNWFSKADETAMNQRMPGQPIEELRKSLDKAIASKKAK